MASVQACPRCSHRRRRGSPGPRGRAGRRVIGVRADDRVGLLSRVAAAIEHTTAATSTWARVQTRGSAVIDAFCLAGPYPSDATRERMTQEILAAVPALPPKPTAADRGTDPDQDWNQGEAAVPMAGSMFESLSDQVDRDAQGSAWQGRAHARRHRSHLPRDPAGAARGRRLAESSVPSSPGSRRAKGAEVSGALNPAQQIVKIVNDELVGILGGETRRIEFARPADPSSCWQACRAPVRRRARRQARGVAAQAGAYPDARGL